MLLEDEDTKNSGDELYSLSLEQRTSMELEDLPLPEGWIRDFDPTEGHHFYVDAKANPPRSIWDHPWEDTQWQQEHPEGHQRGPNNLLEPPPPAYDSEPPAPEPGNVTSTALPGHTVLEEKPQSDLVQEKTSPLTAESSGIENVAGVAPPSPAQGPGRKTLFQKIFGTPEEREAAKRVREVNEAERAKKYLEQRTWRMENRSIRRIERRENRLNRQEERLERRRERDQGRLDRREEHLERQKEDFNQGQEDHGRLEQSEERFERRRDKAEERYTRQVEKVQRAGEKLAKDQARLWGRFGQAQGEYGHSGEYDPPPAPFSGRRRIE